MVTFKAEELKSVIGKCARFSTTKGLIPEHGFLAMREGYIFATDGIIGIKYRNPVTFSEDFVLPSETFSRILSSFSSFNTKVKLIKKEDHTLLKAGVFKLKFPDLQEYSIDMDIPPDDAKKPLPDGFGECLSKILFSVPKDDKVKESLKGVHYDGKSFYASDNIKLSRLTPKFKLDNTLFIPTQLLEHLVGEDKPLAYCIASSADAGLLWFWFEEYVIFSAIKGTIFPMGEETFDKIESKKSNSVIISANSDALKEKIDRISILAEQHMNRVNLVSLGNELAIYTQLPGGTEVIDFLPVISNASEGQKAEFLAVDIKYLKEEIDLSSDFFFTEDFIYFSNKDGLDSVLKPLGVEDGVSVIERVGEYYNNRSESGDATGMDSEGTGS